MRKKRFEALLLSLVLGIVSTEHHADTGEKCFR